MNTAEITLTILATNAVAILIVAALEYAIVRGRK